MPPNSQLKMLQRTSMKKHVYRVIGCVNHHINCMVGDFLYSSFIWTPG